ncbi:CPBP family intramembrane metalloprotease [Chloroflexi bacterium TSY]|nr:CPBP family intramembrane metalloprotease [Chloroflexi bacterium TSY]
MSIAIQNTGTQFFDWVKRHQTLVFVVLAYGLSWSIFIAHIILQVDSPIILLGVYGPSVAAIMLTGYLAGWQGVRKLLKRFAIWRVGLHWYVYLAVGFVLIELAGYGLYRLLGGPALAIAVPTLTSILPVLFFQILIPGLGEEFGWRGFALPRLQAQWNPLTASLILGLLHISWHFPTYWLGNGTHNVPLVLVILWAIPWTILYTWIFNNTRGSILIAVLYHALFGVTLSFMPFLPPESVVPITPALIRDFNFFDSVFGPYIATVAVFWVVAAIIVVATKGDLSYNATSDQE